LLHSRLDCSTETSRTMSETEDNEKGDKVPESKVKNNLTAALDQVFADHPLLHYFGYEAEPWETGSKQGGYRKSLERTDYREMIFRLAAWCLTLDAKRVRNHNSYGLKHLAEKEIGEYVTNGQLITGMLLDGYSISRCGYNPVFKGEINQRQDPSA
jgi:hypothetical protein